MIAGYTKRSPESRSYSRLLRRSEASVALTVVSPKIASFTAMIIFSGGAPADFIRSTRHTLARPHFLERIPMLWRPSG